MTRRRALALLVALLFTGYLAELAPHLVHHLFDEEEAAAPACPFFAQPNDGPVACEPPSTLAPTPVVVAPPPPPAAPRPARLTGSAARPRAPPAVPPSAFAS